MKKNIHAVKLGRLGGKAGTGDSKARTTEQARKAANARWAKRRKMITVGLALLCLCGGCREQERVINPANIPTDAQLSRLPGGKELSGENNVFLYNPEFYEKVNGRLVKRPTGRMNAVLGTNAQRMPEDFEPVELVLRFRSGKEFRMALPTNDPVALDFFVEK